MSRNVQKNNIKSVCQTRQTPWDKQLLFLVAYPLNDFY